MRDWLGRHWLLLILGVAFAGRVVLAVGLQNWLDGRAERQFLIEGDANGYWELGQRLADGQAYEIYSPPRRALRMPGFPAVLAASMKVPPGNSLLVARLVLAAVGTAACALVYLLGKELVDENTGLIAAGLTAVSPTMAGFSVVIESETLFAACLVASLWAVVKLIKTEGGPKPTGCNPWAFRGCNPWAFRGSNGWALRRREIGQSLLAGATMALACYVRPIWLLVGPAFALLYVLMAEQKKRAAMHGVLVVAVLFAALTPWAIRNKIATGHPVFTTLWMGPSLYDGLNPQATGDSEMTFFDRDRPLLKGMSEYEVDRYYRDKAVRFVLDHPARTAELAVVKLVRFWKPWPNAEQFRSLPMRTAVAVFFIPMLALAILGIWVCRTQPWFWLLTAGPVLYFAAVHMVFVSSLRYRLPAEYPLCVASAVGLRCWLKWQAARFPLGRG